MSGSIDKTLAPAASEGAIEVATQNIQNILFAPKAKKRIRTFVERLNHAGDSFDPDVVTVNEAFLGLSRRKLKTSSQHPYFSIPTEKRWRLLNSGLAALSRYKILATNEQYFDVARNMDTWANKGVIMIRIAHPQLGEVDIYTTHMQASYRNEHQYDETRTKQSETIEEFIYRCSGGRFDLDNKKSVFPRTVILMGDFNMGENAPGYEKIKAMGFHDVMRELFPDDPLYTWRKDNPYVPKRSANQSLDHILLSPAEGWEWDKEHSTGGLTRPCSSDESNEPSCLDAPLVADHAGLIANLRLKRETVTVINENPNEARSGLACP